MPSENTHRPWDSFQKQARQRTYEEIQDSSFTVHTISPQTNGLVERFNRTLCEALAKLTEKEKNWDDHIAPVLFAYRTSQHSTTKVTPFLLTHGCEATLPMDDPTKFVEQDKGDPYSNVIQR